MGTAQSRVVLFAFSKYHFLMGQFPKIQVSLNHIGVAVSDLPQMKKLFLLLGLPVDHVESVPDQGVNTHFIPLPMERGFVELLEPTDQAGSVQKSIDKRGPGVHHLSFAVKKGELEPLVKQLRSEGYRFIYEEPKLGAHSMKVNFIHPACAGGILIELMEPLP